MWTFVNKLASPQHCYRVISNLQPWIQVIMWLLFCSGLVLALGVAPSDVQQGEVYRILFLHVPAAVMSLLVYAMMAITTLIYQVWKIKLADMVAKVSAPLGALFTLITLISGALWGRPTWGTYWIWDARLTAELVLLFVYLGIMALRSAIADVELAAKATGLLTLVGVVNLPIVHYSVQWWHTLHQGATLLKFAKPSIAQTMLWPLLLMLLAYVFFYAYSLCLRLRHEIVVREQGARWLQHYLLRKL